MASIYRNGRKRRPSGHSGGRTSGYFPLRGNSNLPLSVQRGNSNMSLSEQRGNSNMPLQRGNSGTNSYSKAVAARGRSGTEQALLYVHWN